MHESRWVEHGLEFDDGVEEPRLIVELHGGGFVKRRSPGNAADRTESRDGVGDLRGAITDVGTEREVCEVCHLKSGTEIMFRDDDGKLRWRRS